MKKGKIEKICGVKIYRKFESKAVEERGRIKRPVVFRSKKDYSRNRNRKETEVIIRQVAAG